MSSLLLVLSLPVSFAVASSAGAAGSSAPAGAGARTSMAVAQTVQPVGVLSTIAGTLQGNGSSSLAQQPVGLAVGPAGLVVADEGGNFARLVAADSATESVLAGNGVAGYNGDDRAATTASLAEPTAAVVDHLGDTIIADTYSNVIRLVAGVNCSSACPFGLTSMLAGDIYTIAGDHTAGYSGKGSPAVAAMLKAPSGLAIDPRGDLLIADTYNDVVRLVAAAACSSACPYNLPSMVAGDIYTIAGNGDYGFGGNKGLATLAELGFPTGITVDAAGDAIVADAGTSMVSLISYAACSAQTTPCSFGLSSETIGDIYTLAGTGTGGYNGDSGPAKSTELDADAGVAIDSEGNLLIADTLNDIVRMVPAAACSTDCAYGLGPLTAGDIYTIAGDGIAGYSGDDIPAQGAELDGPTGLAVDAAGNVLIADTGNDRVRMLAAATCSGSCGYGLVSTTALDIYTVAGDGAESGSGDGAAANNAELDSPGGVVVDPHDDVVIADSGNNVIRLAAAAGCAANCPYGLSSTVAGDIYTIAGNGTLGDSGDGSPGASAELDDPGGLGIGADGDLVFADSGNNQIRLVAEANCPAICPYGLSSTVAGDIYTLAGSTTGAAGYSGDGGPASHAELSAPGDVTALPSKDLLVADSSNNRIRLIAAVACSSGCPYGLASTTAGDIYTVAGDGTYGYSGDGGSARSEQLASPQAVAVGPSSDLIISDTMNERIRLVAAVTCATAKKSCPYGLSTTEGDIYTVAGDGEFGDSGNLGPGPKASLAMPLGVAVDAAGDIFIADSANDEVREVSNVSCGFSCLYGVSTAPVGTIAIVAGTGTLAASPPDGRPSTGMPLADPVAMAGYPGGGVLIAEAGQDSVRLLTSDPSTVSALPPQGYWLACADGAVFAAGGAPALAYTIVPSSDPVVGIAATADGKGYWVVTANGSVYTSGNARYLGSLPGIKVHVSDIVAIAPTGDGGGYWMIGRDGGEFAFGDAHYHGSLPGLGIHVDNIVGMVATSDGGGYWIVGSDGGVFAFGDTHYVGSLPGLGIHVNDIRAMIPSPSREGYVLVGADGGAFVFGQGVHYYGSLPGEHKSVSDIIGLALTPDTLGYWLASSKGIAYHFGDAKGFQVSSAVKAHLPVVAITGT